MHGTRKSEKGGLPGKIEVFINELFTNYNAGH